MIDYDLEPEQYKALPLEQMPAEDLAELAYFLWCVYPDLEDLMVWREQRLLPLVRATADQLPAEEDA